MVDKRRSDFISRALLVLQADILTFAGLAFFTLAILKNMKLSNGSILIISIFMNLFNFLLFKIMKPPKNFLLSQLLGYFVVTNAESFFSLFSYFIFVALGYYIGDIIKNIADKDRLSNNIIIIFSPIVTIYYFLRSHYDFPYLPKYLTDEHSVFFQDLMQLLLVYAIFYH